MLSELNETINARRRIYLLRHGEVSYFDSEGRPVVTREVVLNQEGRLQAAAAAEVLREVPFTRLISTGLARTEETADHLARDRDVSREIEHDLREIEPGRLGDINAKDLETRFARAFREIASSDARFLGGELFREHRARVLCALDRVLGAPATGDLAIVAHGGTNRVILAHALGADPASFGALEQDAGALNIIDREPDGGFIVRLVNYSPLSPAKLGLRATTMERIFLDSIAPHLDKTRE